VFGFIATEGGWGKPRGGERERILLNLRFLLFGSVSVVLGVVRLVFCITTAEVVGRYFQHIKQSSAIHAAGFMGRDDRNRGADAVVKRESLGRFLMGEGTGVDERSSLTQRAMGVAALKKRDQPSDNGKSHAKNENFRRERGRLEKKTTSVVAVAKIPK